MAALKTKPTRASVRAFIAKIDDNPKRADCLELLALMESVTGCKGTLWGSSIVGFGTYHYCYASGREGDWPITGFSPRKHNTTIYVMLGFSRYEALMTRLGPHKLGKSCLYFKRLDDLDRRVLRQLLVKSVADMRRLYPCA
ncbi:MAG: DUF1801 domain-containing protein [Verrucomicrobia bacterium]|nr:DUF1801 domain-containing protein [Verrucomicrobiota bacterium]